MFYSTKMQIIDPDEHVHAVRTFVYVLYGSPQAVKATTLYTTYELQPGRARMLFQCLSQAQNALILKLGQGCVMD